MQRAEAQIAQAPLPPHVHIRTLRKQLTNAQESINYLITHDPLTGCHNRAGILDALRCETTRLKRQECEFGVLVFGADRFRKLNHTYWEIPCDSVLRAIVRRVTSSIRPYDTLGRCGDSEFMIVAPGCTLRDAVTMAERIREIFDNEDTDISQEITFDDSCEPPKPRPIRVTLSVGVFSSSEVKEADALRRAAKEAYSRAKSEGGNKVVKGSISIC